MRPPNPLRRNHLAFALLQLWRRTGESLVLAAAIEELERAVEVAGAYPERRAAPLTHLASALRYRFKQQGAAADLARAIDLFDEAVRVSGSVDARTAVGNLGVALSRRQELDGDPDSAHRAAAAFAAAGGAPVDTAAQLAAGLIGDYDIIGRRAAGRASRISLMLDRNCWTPIAMPAKPVSMARWAISSARESAMETACWARSIPAAMPRSC